MSYYDSSSVMNLLKLAYQGNAQAVKQIVDIDVPFAAAPDYSVVEGPIMQINRSTFKVSHAVNGVKQSDIEACFHTISSTVIEPPPRKKTLLDNPLIPNKLIERFAFDAVCGW